MRGVDGQAGVVASCEISDHVFDCGQDGAGRDQRHRGLDLRGQAPVGTGRPDAALVEQAYDGPGRGRGLVPAVSPAVARSSRPRAAVSSSTASTRVSPSTDRRSLRAALQPIETWSSCIALDGYRVDAGRHRRAA